ncbi:IMP cyclohydrolase [Candidatus Nitrotoga sp. BS]|nr:IMP cyclohydrolase [Candidatus Nitrotoga sp. BS]
MRENEFQRAPLECVATGDCTSRVFPYPFFEIVRVAGVVAAVGTAKNVDPECH